MRRTRALLPLIIVFFIAFVFLVRGGPKGDNGGNRSGRQLDNSQPRQHGPEAPTVLLPDLARNLSTLRSKHRILIVSWLGREEFPRALAAEATWLAELPSNIHVLFFTTASDLAAGPPPRLRSTLITLPHAKPAYPPQAIMFEALRFIGEQLLDEFDFLVRVDSDVYVNLEKLVSFLDPLHPGELHFIGAPGLGRGEAVKKIGLPHEFCLGGSGMIFSQPVVTSMVENLRTCITSVALPNEDTELSRCVWLSAKAYCMLAGFQGPALRRLFYNVYLSVPTRIGRLRAGLPKRLPSVALDAIIVHPVRTRSEFDRFDLGARLGVRPLLDTAAPYTNEKAIYRTACTHNTVAQVELMCVNFSATTLADCPWTGMRRCTPRPPPAPFALRALAPHWQHYTKIYIYSSLAPSAQSLPAEAVVAGKRSVHGALAAGAGHIREIDAHKQRDGSRALGMDCLRQALLKHNITEQAIAPPLTGADSDDEMQSLRSIFVSARKTRQPITVVVHAAAQRSSTVAHDLEEQFSNAVCGGHLLTAHGGALLLSPPAAPYGETAQTLVGGPGRKSLLPQEDICHDTPLKEATFFAAAFHQHTIPFLIRAIDESVRTKNKATTASLTHALIMAGFPVRSVRPSHTPFIHPAAIPAEPSPSVPLRPFSPTCDKSFETTPSPDAVF
jgi:hypothetical protein